MTGSFWRQEWSTHQEETVQKKRSKQKETLCLKCHNKKCLSIYSSLENTPYAINDCSDLRPIPLSVNPPPTLPGVLGTQRLNGIEI